MRRTKGFTLVELLVVIAIIGILVTMVVPALLRAVELSRQSVCAANLNAIGKALSQYMADNRSHTPRLTRYSEPHVWDVDDDREELLLDSTENLFAVAAAEGEESDAGIEDNETGDINAMQNIWPMVAEAMIQDTAFQCPSDKDWAQRHRRYKDRNNEFWQYGWTRATQFSFGIQWPYDAVSEPSGDDESAERNPAPFTSNLSGPVVVFADRSPVAEDEHVGVNDGYDYEDDPDNPTKVEDAIIVRPSHHPKDGENVLTMGGQVRFHKERGRERNPMDSRAGRNGDDIYTSNEDTTSPFLPGDDDETDVDEGPWDTVITPLPSRYILKTGGG